MAARSFCTACPVCPANWNRPSCPQLVDTAHLNVAYLQIQTHPCSNKIWIWDDRHNPSIDGHNPHTHIHPHALAGQIPCQLVIPPHSLYHLDVNWYFIISCSWTPSPCSCCIPRHRPLPVQVLASIWVQVQTNLQHLGWPLSTPFLAWHESFPVCIKFLSHFFLFVSLHLFDSMCLNNVTTMYKSLTLYALNKLSSCVPLIPGVLPVPCLLHSHTCSTCTCSILEFLVLVDLALAVFSHICWTYWQTLLIWCHQQNWACVQTTCPNCHA